MTLTFESGSALRVLIYPDRAAMGAAAAARAAELLRTLIAQNGGASAVFASAPSQQEFLTGLAHAQGIDWSRVQAFHLDEYVGLPATAPQAFGQFLRDRLFSVVNPGAVHYLDGNAADPQEECARYARLLAEHPLDLALVGIGENGHIAFNDPHVADFVDPVAVKVVDLDQRSREQQVHDGCFTALHEVPKHALTMTMPAITAARQLLCMVPGPTKAAAIRDTLTGPISTTCPASILRTHGDATLYIDTESASLLPGNGTRTGA